MKVIDIFTHVFGSVLYANLFFFFYFSISKNKYKISFSAVAKWRISGNVNVIAECWLNFLTLKKYLYVKINEPKLPLNNELLHLLVGFASNM